MPNDLIKLRRLMKAAHYMQENYPVILRGASINQSQALKYAWWFEDLRNKLRSGVWQFTYLKTDGTIREARGTLSSRLIPDWSPKVDPSEVLPPVGTFTYWDIDKNGWRSFCLDNFIGFIEQIA